MSLSWMTWLVLAALLVFWAVGAHNRLVRLRAAARAAVEQLAQPAAAEPALTLNPGGRAALLEAVQRYNEAIGQFPASVLARLLQMKPLDPSAFKP